MQPTCPQANYPEDASLRERGNSVLSVDFGLKLLYFPAQLQDNRYSRSIDTQIASQSESALGFGNIATGDIIGIFLNFCADHIVLDPLDNKRFWDAQHLRELHHTYIVFIGKQVIVLFLHHSPPNRSFRGSKAISFDILL